MGCLVNGCYSSSTLRLLQCHCALNGTMIPLPSSGSTTLSTCSSISDTPISTSGFKQKSKIFCPIFKTHLENLIRMVVEKNYSNVDDSSSENESNGNEDDRFQNDDSDDITERNCSSIVNEENSSSHDSSPTDGQELKQEEKATPKKSSRSARIRDLLIMREINNDRLPTMLPPTIDMIFADPNELHSFKIKVSPSEGFWTGGTFFFDVLVPEEYNFEPPKVSCKTKIWHPNISEDGSVCLSILRSHAIDESGWNPTRQLKDVVLGINSLFTDLVNFHDPLNSEAAEMFQRDPHNFQAKVSAYIQKYARNNTT